MRWHAVCLSFWSSKTFIRSRHETSENVDGRGHRRLATHGIRRRAKHRAVESTGELALTGAVAVALTVTITGTFTGTLTDTVAVAVSIDVAADARQSGGSAPAGNPAGRIAAGRAEQPELADSRLAEPGLFE
jgi:hypothetical protein